MLTNCLAECAHLTITVSQTEWDIGRKSSFSHSPLAFDAPVKGVPNFPSEHLHPVWYGQTRMAWLPDSEKISKISLSFSRNSRTWQTDGHRVTAYTALMHMHRAVKMIRLRWSAVGRTQGSPILIDFSFLFFHPIRQMGPAVGDTCAWRKSIGALCFYFVRPVVPMSVRPATSVFLSLRKNTQWISMKFV